MLLVGAAVAIAGLAGALAPLDGLAYDPAASVVARLPREPSRVLLVVGDPARPPDESTLVTVMEELSALGAARIVFAEIPAGAGRRFFETAARLGRVTLGRPVARGPAHRTGPRLAPIPPQAAGLSLEWGAVDIPPARGGVHRGQWATIEVDEGRYTALETLVARKVGAVLPASLGDDYLVRFRGGAGGLPRLALDQVVAKKLVPALVADRIALLGTREGSLTPLLVTPTAGSNARMSLLDLEGQALDALIGGRIVTRTGPAATLALVLLATLAAMTVHRRLSPRASAWFAVALTMAWWVLAVAVLWHRDTWIPVAEVALVELLVLLDSLGARAPDTLRATSRTWTRVWAGLEPTSSAGDVESQGWNDAVRLVGHTIDVRRSAFLAPIRRGPRLEVVGCLGCEATDVPGEALDSRKPPVRTALDASRPVGAPGILRPGGDQEVTYLTPLVSGGEVFGFWAVAVGPAAAANPRGIEAQIWTHAREVAALLASRRRGAAEAILARTSAHRPLQALETAVEAMDRRMALLHAWIGGLATATIVYDLFGRLVEVNEAMGTLLGEDGLSPQTLTALDLLGTLTGHQAPRVRQMLGFVVAGGGSLSVPATLRRVPARAFLLHVRALRHEDLRGSPRERPPFGVEGIVLEILETTAWARLRQQRASLAVGLEAKVRHDLAAIQLSASLLAAGDLASEEAGEAIGAIQRKVDHAVEVVGECATYLARDAQELGTRERYPVAGRDALCAALEAIGDLAREGAVTIEVDLPRLLADCLASQSALEEIFEAVLTLLIRDCPHGATVWVGARQEETLVSYTFRNVGFGIPDERLGAYLASPSPLESPDMERVRRALAAARAIGGELQLASEPGAGFRASLRLPNFL